MDTPIFGDFDNFRDFLILRPGSSPLLPWRSQDVGGSSQLWNGGLRALEEAWDDFLLEAFFCQVWFGRFLCSWGVPGGLPEVSICVLGGLKR